MEEPAATPLTVIEPELCPAAIVNTEGDIPTSFDAELTSVTLTPPAPAGAPRVTLPLIELPTLMEELGRENEIPDEVTLKGKLVAEASPGLLAAIVKPLPGVEIPRLEKVAIPWTADTVVGPLRAPPGLTLSVTGFCALTTRLPLLSMTLTAGAGLMGEPATVLDGCVLKTK